MPFWSSNNTDIIASYWKYSKGRAVAIRRRSGGVDPTDSLADEAVERIDGVRGYPRSICYRCCLTYDE